MGTSEVLKAIVAALFRNALLAISAWFIARGWLKEGQVSDEQVLLLAGAAAGAIVAVAWSLVGKIRTKYNIDAALLLPSHASYEDVKAKAAELRKVNLTGTNAPLIGIALICLFVSTTAFMCSPADVKRQSLEKAHEVEVGLGTAYDTVQNLRQNTLIPVETERKSIKAIQTANKAVIAFNDKANAIDSNKVTEDQKQDLIDAWKVVIEGLKDPDILAAAGIKSPLTQQTIEAVISTAIKTADGIMSTLRRIKTIKPTPSKPPESSYFDPDQGAGLMRARLVG